MIDNNSSTGQGTMKFQFYSQFNELLDKNHDVDFPVIGTAKGVTIVRPEAPLREPHSLENRSGSPGVVQFKNVQFQGRVPC